MCCGGGCVVCKGKVMTLPSYIGSSKQVSNNVYLSRWEPDAGNLSYLYPTWRRGHLVSLYRFQYRFLADICTPFVMRINSYLLNIEKQCVGFFSTASQLSGIACGKKSILTANIYPWCWYLLAMIIVNVYNKIEIRWASVLFDLN